MNCVETTASRDEKHSYFRAWCDLYSISDGNFVLQIYIKNKSIHQPPFFIHMLQFSQHNSVFISRKKSKNFVSQYQRKKITNIRVILVSLYLICSLRYQWITDSKVNMSSPRFQSGKIKPDWRPERENFRVTKCTGIAITAPMLFRLKTKYTHPSSHFKAFCDETLM